YEYCKNHKKRAKTGQKRTRERKEYTRAGNLSSKVNHGQLTPVFEKVWDEIQSFVPMDSELELQRLKIAGQDVEEKPAKRQKIEEVSRSVQEKTDEDPKTDELSQEQLHQMKIIVLEERMHVKALQIKYPIIAWEVYSDQTMKF
nr:hypothetical protein [Tanacetum cinerariifolium]